MENTKTITLGGETLKEMETFTYLGRTIGEREGSDANAKVRIDNTMTAFL